MRTPTAGNRGGLKIEDIMKAKDTSMFFRLKGECEAVKLKIYVTRGPGFSLLFSETKPSF